jgi:hypothetical protein
MRLRFILSSLMLVLLIAGCSRIILSQEKNYIYLVPDLSGVADTSFRVEDETLIWEQDGLKIEITHMNDTRLNAQFPEESRKGKFSINPYTYGNYVDMELGYIPSRFTVFAVKVYNYTRPKVGVEYRDAHLFTDVGRELYPFAQDKNEITPNNFDSYYKREMGASGNERRRYEDRMGLVKQSLWQGGALFKGDKNEGFLAFAPISVEARGVELDVVDFVMQYDANDWPVEKMTLRFPFKRLGAEETALRMKKVEQSDVQMEDFAAKYQITGEMKLAQLLLSKSQEDRDSGKLRPVMGLNENLADYFLTATGGEISTAGSFLPDDSTFITEKVNMLIMSDNEAFSYTANDVRVMRNYLRAGGFVYVDDRLHHKDLPFSRVVQQFFSEVLERPSVFVPILNSHQIYSFVYEMDGPPPGADQLQGAGTGTGMAGSQQSYSNLEGAYFDGRLCVLLNNKSYLAGFSEPGISRGNQDAQKMKKFIVNLLGYVMAQKDAFGTSAE